MKKLFTLFLSCALGKVSFGQEITIVNESNSSPIENVVVFNKDLSVATFSNDRGKVDISRFKKDDSIYFKHPSFEQVAFSFSALKERKFLLKLERIDILMDDIVVSASRWKEKKRDVPYMMDVIPLNDPKNFTAQSSADILTNTGNVMVQKSQGGGGSPIIRGFEANRLLLVVDGVRMNNAIYRSGHLQNSMTLDNGGLERVEVIYGPSSVIYGSDALGGVIHYYTFNPQLSGSKRAIFKMNASTQFASANQSNIHNVSFNVGFKRIAFRTSYTQSNFGDIRMGKHRNPFTGDAGKVYTNTVVLDGKDSVVDNRNPDVQLKTSYKQYDLTQKVLVALTKNLELVGNIQYSTSSNIDRFDELTNKTDGIPNYATWYYGPQNRFFSSLRLLSTSENRFYSNFTTTVAYQNIDEDRINRKFKRNNELHQEEDVDVYSLNMDFLKFISSRNRLNYGVEVNYNDVNSKGFNKDIRNDLITDALSRYPDKGSNIFSMSAYTGYKWTPSTRYILSAGLRYSQTEISSKFSDAYDMMPFSKVNISAGALTGSGSVIYHPHSDWQVSTSFSTGFRAPNVDDYGKVRAKDQEVTLPNNQLKPEYAYNVEIGTQKTFAGSFSIGGNFFYTYITNAIVNSYGSIDGKDSLLYNGDMYRIIINKNSNRAYIRGFNFFLKYNLSEKARFTSNINYTKGHDISNDVPLAHIPPIFGGSSVSYKFKFLVTEISCNYHGWKKVKDYSPFGEDNLPDATEYGSPAWLVANFRSTLSLGKIIQLQLAVENIFDSYYRVFASGVSAPGRNFIITLKATI